MQPIVNLEEHPGKVVGRRVPTLADYDRLVDNSMALGGDLPYPKGVYRFRSHEEADAWMNQHMMAAAKMKQSGIGNSPQGSRMKGFRGWLQRVFGGSD